jgi:hypothetical protein
MCFGKADATLRAYGVLNRLDTIRPGPSHSLSALQALWAGQVLGRLSNLAAHILLAAITSAALFLALRSLLQSL